MNLPYRALCPYTSISNSVAQTLSLVCALTLGVSVALAQPTAPQSTAPQSTAPHTHEPSALSGLPLPDQGPQLSPDTGIRADQWALSFAFPMGGFGYSGFEDVVGSLGAWRLLTHEVALGLFAGLRIVNQDISVGGSANEILGGESATQTQQVTSSELTLSPSVKYYTYQKGPIALFGIAQVHMRFYSDGDEATTTDKEPGVGETYNADEDLQLRAHLGFGAEWFATTSLSFAGHFGLQIDLLSQDAQGLSFETFTSGLSAQVYF